MSNSQVNLAQNASALSPEFTNYLLGLLGLSILSLFVYLVVLYFWNRARKNRRVLFYQLRFNPINLDGLSNINRFTTFFSSLHHSLGNSLITFEYHHTKNFDGFLITTSNPETIKTIKTNLDKIGSVEIAETNQDPLKTYLLKGKNKSVREVYLNKDFYSIKTNDASVLENAIHYLRENDLEGALLFVIKPNSKALSIDSIIRGKARQMSRKNAPVEFLKLENEKLKKKKERDLFTVKILTIANSHSDTNVLESYFHLLDDDNRFYSGLTSSNIKSLRFLPVESVFGLITGSKGRGSYLNSKELACLVHWV
jgi:hypothetical protein